MDLTEPGLAFSGSLTMPILRALHGRSVPASGAQISRMLPEATPAGVRRALERLSQHGVCTREEIGGRALYSLDYEHVLYGAIRAALDANDEFQKRLRKSLSNWDPAPMTAVLFGSAARHDGDIQSDVDILLVRPRMTARDRERYWTRQVHELRTQVRAWTGNNLHALDWSRLSLDRHALAGEELINEILEDGITLAGNSLDELLEFKTV